MSLVSSSNDSSLGHMCRFAPSMHQCFIPEIGVLKDEAFTFLRAATTPQFIPATAFAMALPYSVMYLNKHPLLICHKDR